jgi:hypothetical protein
MLDTTPAARRFYYQPLSRMSSRERLALMNDSSRMVRAVAESAIRREHPAASAEELRARLAVRLYGREVVRRVLPSIPEDAR